MWQKPPPGPTAKRKRPAMVSTTDFLKQMSQAAAGKPKAASSSSFNCMPTKREDAKPAASKRPFRISGQKRTVGDGDDRTTLECMQCLRPYKSASGKTKKCPNCRQSGAVVSSRKRASDLLSPMAADIIAMADQDFARSGASSAAPMESKRRTPYSNRAGKQFLRSIPEVLRLLNEEQLLEAQSMLDMRAKPRLQAPSNELGESGLAPLTEQAVSAEDLPCDVLYLTIQLMDVRSVCNICCVSQRLRKIAQLDEIWQPNYFHFWGLVPGSARPAAIGGTLGLSKPPNVATKGSSMLDRGSRALAAAPTADFDDEVGSPVPLHSPSNVIERKASPHAWFDMFKERYCMFKANLFSNRQHLVDAIAKETDMFVAPFNSQRKCLEGRLFDNVAPLLNITLPACSDDEAVKSAPVLIDLPRITLVVQRNMRPTMRSIFTMSQMFDYQDEAQAAMLELKAKDEAELRSRATETHHGGTDGAGAPATPPPPTFAAATVTTPKIPLSTPS